MKGTSLESTLSCWKDVTVPLLGTLALQRGAFFSVTFVCVFFVRRADHVSANSCWFGGFGVQSGNRDGLSGAGLYSCPWFKGGRSKQIKNWGRLKAVRKGPRPTSWRPMPLFPSCEWQRARNQEDTCHHPFPLRVASLLRPEDGGGMGESVNETVQTPE